MELEISFFDTTLVAVGKPDDEGFEISEVYHKEGGADCTWLLHSALADDVNDATHMAWSEWREEEKVCAAEAREDQRREERMCQSC